MNNGGFFVRTIRVHDDRLRLVVPPQPHIVIHMAPGSCVARNSDAFSHGQVERAALYIRQSVFCGRWHETAECIGSVGQKNAHRVLACFEAVHRGALSSIPCQRPRKRIWQRLPQLACLCPKRLHLVVVGGRKPDISDGKWASSKFMTTPATAMLCTVMLTYPWRP